MKEVTIITLTRKRIKLVQRAIASVQKQTLISAINHLILIDGCEESAAWFFKMEHEGKLPENLLWVHCLRNKDVVSGPGRSAILRNYGVRISNTQWVSFLDDDNEFESNHIESLLRLASESKSPAVHSHCKVLYASGDPFLEARDPWCQDPEESRLVFEYMLEKGVRSENSNIFKDRLDTDNCAYPVRTVDTGEWFLSRDLLLDIPFEEEYTPDDWDNMTSEDDKLNQNLIKNNIPVECTHLATLLYYLGGYSNTRIHL